MSLGLFCVGPPRSGTGGATAGANEGAAPPPPPLALLLDEVVEEGPDAEEVLDVGDAGSPLQPRHHAAVEITAAEIKMDRFGVRIARSSWGDATSSARSMPAVLCGNPRVSPITN
jgi:hypothetical protein